MTETPTGAPEPETTFETLESRLEAVARKLEDPEVPLEERLRLHTQATAIYQQLEARLEAARQATAATENDAAQPAASTETAEPYEAVRDRLAEVVAALESDELPLARIVELHAEARRLAARCEAILGVASEKIGDTAAPAPVREDDDGDVPF